MKIRTTRLVIRRLGGGVFVLDPELIEWCVNKKNINSRKIKIFVHYVNQKILVFYNGYSETDIGYFTRHFINHRLSSKNCKYVVNLS